MHKYNVREMMIYTNFYCRVICENYCSAQSLLTKAFLSKPNNLASLLLYIIKPEMEVAFAIICSFLYYFTSYILVHFYTFSIHFPKAKLICESGLN